MKETLKNYSARLKTKKIVVLLLAVLFFLPAFSQTNNDSIAEGVVVVKRPPVKASYTVKIVYDYQKSWGKKRFWESRVKTFRRGYKAWLSDPYPPQPVSVAHKSSDSVNLEADSIAMIEFESKSDKPVAFDYVAYTSHIPHYFAWVDSLKLDSARFEYDIDTKGRVRFIPVPWVQTDSCSRQLEAEAIPVMRKLWMWYPAQHLSNRNSRLENVACKVYITIYAFDPSVSDPVPIIVIQN